MAEINGIALLKTVRAVDEKIWTLKAQMDQCDEEDDEIGYLADEMLSYMNAAEDLRIGYEEAFRLSSSLLPYEELVREYPDKPSTLG